MPLTGADARRWLERFEAAERADREAKRREGPHPVQSIALPLSIMSAARVAARGQSLLDPRRAEEDEAVRTVWARLRSRLLS